jgi:putative oxidoreductase
MKIKIFQTDPSDSMSFLLRLILALVILPHGLQKLTGAFGGYGFEGTMNYFTETVGVPWIFGFLVIFLESVGMIFLMMGFFTRGIALFLSIVMIGAATMHLQNGFFMNWFNNHAGEGIEFFILAIALATHCVAKGAGKFSIDAIIEKKYFSARPAF